ncbi:MAG: ribonuclease PH [Verrucomicrobiota bacterium]
MSRPDGRSLDQLRPITFQSGIAPHADGSVLVSFGQTQVICAACIQKGVPRWMLQQNVPGGWLTAEYSMLPYATLERKPRDISRGKLDGRSSEIQRLIGRSLRAVVDLKKLGQRTLWIDCDVLRADGGTRTASITGACVAVALAMQKLMLEAGLAHNPLKKFVSAISVGVFDGQVVLDLDYPEDKDASVDANLVFTEDLEFVELQSSGEEATFSQSQLDEMLALGKKGAQEITGLQKEAVSQALAASTNHELQKLAQYFKPS